MKPVFIAAVVLAFLVYFAPWSYSQQSTPKDQQESGNQSPLSSGQVHSETEAYAAEKQPPHWYESPEWILVIVGFVTAFVIGWQSWETRRAAQAAAESVDAAKESAAAAKLNAEALVASERAWVEGEIIESNAGGLSVYRYALRIANLGKTPGQIRSYKISTGPLNEGHPFDQNTLSHQHTRNLHIFIGSGAEQILEDDINMDNVFPDISNLSDHAGAFCVSVKYADTVTGTPDDRTEHETSLVYVYTPLLHKLEQASGICA